MYSILRILFTWALDTLYLFIYIVTYGHLTIHEGHYLKLTGWYINWNIDKTVQPSNYVTPSTEAGIQEEVRKAKKLRAVGGGHSFNNGPLTEHTILSLDNYKTIVATDHSTNRVTVQAGIRLRDFMSQIEKVGLTLPTLGSTNAQSLGGLVASDLHGTTYGAGYLSSQIVWLKIVDAHGEVNNLHQDTDEFRAAAGAIGALGVVIELCIQCVPLYRLEKKVIILEQSIVHDNIESFLQYNDHLSFYYIGGTTIKSCRMNTWNKTVYEKSFLYNWRHFCYEIFDFILCSLILGIGRFTKKLDIFGPFGMIIMKLFMNRSITTTAADSFSRKLFYRHDEIEYGIPLDQFKNAIADLLKMLQEDAIDYVTIVEIRFCDASKSLLGPGSSRPTVFIELAPSLTIDPNPMFKKAEKIFMSYGGKPHLGKWTTATTDYMKKVHGGNFELFQKIRRQFDPVGKFSNEFTDQVFGPVTED